MDTNELKKLLKGSTSVLILENGEPSFVILGYDSYKNLISGQEKEIKINHSVNQPENERNLPVGEPIPGGSHKFQNRVSEKESELLEKINKQILALKAEIDKEEKGVGVD